VEPTDAHRIHHLMMDLVRAAGLLQPGQAGPAYTLSLSQAFTLHELDAGHPLSQRDLAARLRLDKSSVSRLVADMERDGLLVRERDPEDRRQYRLRLTDRGRRLHRTMASVAHGDYDRWVGAMTAEERAALLTGLTAMLRAVRADTARPEPERDGG